MTIRKLPQQEQRVETGVVQFGDDWPGVFIRGDNAFGYALHLRYLLEENDADDMIAVSFVKGLLSLLESSNVNST